METRNKILILGSDLDTRNEIIEKSFIKVKWNEAHLESFKSFIFNIKNKYYSADVEFLTNEENDIEILNKHKDTLGEIVEAIIIVSNRDGYIQNGILEWTQNFVEDFGPNILLFTSFDEPNESIRYWCTKNQFEIVCVNNNFEEIDKREKVGFERIYEALEAHVWENMVNLTELRPQKDQDLKSKVLLDGEEIQSSVNELNDMLLKGLKFENEDDLEEQLNHMELLVNKFHRMKKMAENLPDDKRRDVAASIALAFSNLLGDDDDGDDIDNDEV